MIASHAFQLLVTQRAPQPHIGTIGTSSVEVPKSVRGCHETPAVHEILFQNSQKEQRRRHSEKPSSETVFLESPFVSSGVHSVLCCELVDD